MTLDELRRQAQADWDDFVRPDRPRILVGSATCGRAAGSLDVIAAFRQQLCKNSLDANVVEVGCLGLCYAEVLVEVRGKQGPAVLYQGVTPPMVPELVQRHLRDGQPVLDKALAVMDGGPLDGVPRFEDLPMVKPQVRIVLRNCGAIDGGSINHSIARGGYAGLSRAFTLGPEEVIEEIKASGLRGRGGAGFPTARKWSLARQSPGTQKYVICNADEGDPGAFMNRSLIEGDPHAVLEGLIIAAYAIGASQGYVYCRAEYPLAIERLLLAVSQMRQKGLLGQNILGSGFDFDIAIKKGAGAFVCGEETGLIASIEGKRGMPRSRPPYPAVSGLFGKPTNINNVETLALASAIMDKGAQWFAQFGTEKSKGTKTFALVGRINRTGLIEVPMGIPLKTVIEDIGGGVLGGARFKAVQTGGPSGGCIPAQHLDLPLDYERLAEVGSIMGSGGMVVMDEDSCMVDVARYFLTFTENESCGKCVPCRTGTQHLLRILTDIAEGRGTPEQMEKLRKLGEAVTMGSLCGLGQTAPNPVMSTLRHFRAEYERHISQKRCDAFVCRQLVGAPCHAACPTGTEPWRYIAHLARGEYEEAYRAIRETNPFPSVCARVCDHKCETHCRLGTTGGEAIAIRELKRVITERMDPSTYQPPRTAANGVRVAVVGSGPAGLTAAHHLSLLGYTVSVFEEESQPGGMLVSGIPAYRLPREVLRREIDSLFDENMTLKCSSALGRDFTLDSLAGEGFRAVFLALGAHKSRQLGVDGEDAVGVLPVMRFLKAFNLFGEELAHGRVGVVGGGNSAIDAARVALRQKGVECVTIFYRRTREEMPAFKEEIEAALAEGIKLVTLVAPTKVQSRDKRLTGVEFIRNELGAKDSSGRPRPVPVAGTEHTISLDTLIAAISEEPDTEAVARMGIEASQGRTLRVEEETLMTNRPGVFAGGDVITGPYTVVDAIAAGKKAAVMIDRYLRGQEMKQPVTVRPPYVHVEPVAVSEDERSQTGRVRPPTLPVESRKRSFSEVESTLPDEEAMWEARRCLRCDLEFTLLKKEEAAGGQT